MMRQRLRQVVFIYLLLPFAACAGESGSDDRDDPPFSDCTREAIAAEMRATLSSIAADTDFSLYIETRSGDTFAFSRGSSTLTTSYESASTSKWVAATVILRLVDEGYLSLASRPQDFIDGWDIDPVDPLYDITLAHLLSFTSGIVDTPVCTDLRRADFESCVRSIAAHNRFNGKRPGTEFYYASSHLQVAGLMAVKARGARNWEEVFTEFRAQTGLFRHGRFDLPSPSNPRLAGGMHWTGAEYAGFLRALDRGQLLSRRLMQWMFSDQTASVVIALSPPLLATGEDWHYGFGHWLECPSPSYDCGTPDYHSSPGAYGAYPFINVSGGFLGIVAREGHLGTFREGKVVFDSIRSEAEVWAACPNER